jgi:hypothetical protein
VGGIMHKLIDSGEVVVSGVGSIQMIFDNAVVVKVNVWFKDCSSNIFTCNPHTYDTVEAVITECGDLELFFNVTDIRTIAWEAFVIEE